MGGQGDCADNRASPHDVVYAPIGMDVGEPSVAKKLLTWMAPIAFALPLLGAGERTFERIPENTAGAEALKDGVNPWLYWGTCKRNPQLVQPAWRDRDDVVAGWDWSLPPDAKPSSRAKLRWGFSGWKDGKLQQLASDVVGGLSINLLAATDWMLVEMDGQPLPAGAMPPTTVVQYGKAAGFSGCNRYTGPIAESAPGTVQIGELAVTRKACDAAANEIEAAFLDRMRATTSYRFEAGRLLLVAPQGDQPPRTLLFAR